MALLARGAHVSEAWREGARVYLHAVAPTGRLFARYSSSPSDEPKLAHEAALRDLVGGEGPLRAPPVLDRARSWLLERGISTERWSGPIAVDAVVAAAAEIARLQLPNGPARRTPTRISRLLTAARVLRSPLPMRDVIMARRFLEQNSLPLVPSHGDFHAGNVLRSGELAWVVDWELCGRYPAGYDLMQFWPGLECRPDRERLFESAIEIIGRSRKSQLMRLRHAVLVQTIVAKLASPLRLDRDREGGLALMALLPETRAAARRH